MDLLIWIAAPLLVVLLGLPYFLFAILQRGAGLEEDRERRAASTQERLAERMQNVETIVTSADWDALHDERASARSEGGGASAERREPKGAEQAQTLARRLEP